MNILITGIQEKNSGKTFFALQLALMLNEIYKKRTIEVYKPLSGSNYFYHSSNTKFALQYGTLISQDLNLISQNLGKFMPNNIRLERYNPIHTLFIPMNVRQFVENRLKTSITTNSLDVPAIIRYTTCKDQEEYKNKLLVNDNIKLPEILQPILDNAHQIVYFSNSTQLKEKDDVWGSKAIESTWNCLVNDITIVEAFNDYAPSEFITNQMDMILLVGPGIVAKINAQQFKKAISFSQRNIKSMTNIVELTGIEELLEIPLQINKAQVEDPVWKTILSWIQ